MKFHIYVIKNGFLLNIIYSKSKVESWKYGFEERMTMFAKIMSVLGPEPDNSIGMELEEKINE